MPPKMATFTDDWAFLDPAKWWNGGTAYVQNGQLYVPRDNNAWAGALYSTQKYDITNSCVFAELVSHSTGPGYTDSYLQVNDAAGGGAQRAMSIDVENGAISIYRANGDGGWTTFAGFPRDPVMQRWIGWFHDGARMIVKTSPDGRTWTELWAIAASESNFDLTQCVVAIGAGGEPTGVPSIWDNLNTFGTGLGGAKRSIGRILDNGLRKVVLTPSKWGSRLIPADAVAVLSVQPIAERLIADDFSTRRTDLWKFPTDAVLTNGQLVIPATDNYYGVVTWAPVSMRGASAEIEIVQIVPAGNTGSLEMYWQLGSNPAANVNNLAYTIYGNAVHPFIDIAGVRTTLASIPFDPVMHRWLRIAERDGFIYWQSSPTGEDPWTTLASWAYTFPIDALYSTLGAGWWDINEVEKTSSAIWDNYSIVGPVIGSAAAVARLTTGEGLAVIERRPE